MATSKVDTVRESPPSVLMVSLPEGNAGGVDSTPEAIVEKRGREEEDLR